LVIILSKDAAKALRKINEPDYTRIKTAIAKIPFGDIKRLVNTSVAYRLRVGDWRILFDMNDKIEIHEILQRGSAYKN